MNGVTGHNPWKGQNNCTAATIKTPPPCKSNKFNALIADCKGSDGVVDDEEASPVPKSRPLPVATSQPQTSMGQSRRIKVKMPTAAHRSRIPVSTKKLLNNEKNESDVKVSPVSNTNPVSHLQRDPVVKVSSTIPVNRTGSNDEVSATDGRDHHTPAIDRALGIFKMRLLQQRSSDVDSVKNTNSESSIDDDMQPETEKQQQYQQLSEGQVGPSSGKIEDCRSPVDVSEQQSHECRPLSEEGFEHSSISFNDTEEVSPIATANIEPASVERREVEPTSSDISPPLHATNILNQKEASVASGTTYDRSIAHEEISNRMHDEFYEHIRQIAERAFAEDEQRRRKAIRFRSQQAASGKIITKKLRILNISEISFLYDYISSRYDQYIQRTYFHLWFTYSFNEDRYNLRRLFNRRALTLSSHRCVHRILPPSMRQACIERLGKLKLAQLYDRFRRYRRCFVAILKYVSNRS